VDTARGIALTVDKPIKPLAGNPPEWFLKQLKQSRPAADPGTSTKDAQLSRAEIRAAEKLLDRALRPRGIPFYSPEERLVLALLAANLSRLQRARGKKSIGEVKAKAAYRKFHVNALLRYVVAERYRKNPKANMTVMEIVNWLDDLGIEASESQVRRDIQDALELGPFPT
jgi:hypothetical protein